MTDKNPVDGASIFVFEEYILCFASNYNFAILKYV